MERRPSLVTIGVAARLTKAPPWQLRAWEESGLLRPSRSPSGYRLYSDEDIAAALRLRRDLNGGHRLQLYGVAAETNGMPQPSPRLVEVDNSEFDHEYLRDLVTTALAQSDAHFLTVVEVNDEGRCTLPVYAGLDHVPELGPELDRTWAGLIGRKYHGPAPLPEPFGDLPGWLTHVDEGVGLLAAGGDGEFLTLLSVTVRSGVRLERERRRLASDVRAWSQRQQAMREIAHAFAASESPARAHLQVLDSAMAIVDATAGAISFANPLRQQYVLAAHRGLSDRYVRGIGAWRLTEGLAGRAYGLKEPVLVDDMQHHEGITREIVRLEKLRTYLCIPLVSASRCFGVLEVMTREPGSFSELDVHALQGLVVPLALAAEGELLKLEVVTGREERSRVFREWAGQAARTGRVQRRELINALRRELVRPLDDQNGGQARAVTDFAHAVESRLEALVSNFEVLNESWLDLVPALRNALAERVSESTGRIVTVEASETWAPVLSTETSSRAYLALAAVVEAAARAATTRVSLRLDQSPAGVIVDVCDDREAPVNVDSVSTVPIEAVGALTTIGATLARTAVGGFPCAVRITIPADPPTHGAPCLTERETAILEGLSSGSTNRELAESYGISPKTLQNHLTAIYRKIGVVNRGGAIAYILNRRSR
jgi:DNA-binding CsgD family transcriptional regulator/GAF domain-containing protein